MSVITDTGTKVTITHSTKKNKNKPILTANICISYTHSNGFTSWLGFIHYMNDKQFHLAIGKEVGSTHDARRNVWWISRATNDTQQLVGQSKARLRNILRLKWCLTH